MSFPYRPNSPEELKAFEQRYCDICISQKDKCRIWDKMKLYRRFSKMYPKQLTYDNDGNPVCTSFEERGKKKIKVKQTEMFN